MAKTLIAFRIDRDLLDEMRAHKQQSGAPLTWQVETAIRAWLDSHSGRVQATARTKDTSKTKTKTKTKKGR